MASEALKVNKSVTNINLGGNQIGPDGAKALAEVRCRCPCECSLEWVNGSPSAFIYCNVVCILYDV
jgi:Ran GTPase-activating protein (RanGAP) involved in mRNA processing and transport